MNSRSTTNIHSASSTDPVRKRKTRTNKLRSGMTILVPGQAAQGLIHVMPRTPVQLHAWVEIVLGVQIATGRLDAARSEQEQSSILGIGPLAYLSHAFFQDRFERSGRSRIDGACETDLRRASSPDRIVWACRGGGKTYLGAVATLLDLLFKPGVTVRILGGSLEQSRRMHEHLRMLTERPALRSLLIGKSRSRDLHLVNGSHAAVLAASQTSVRGTRVQIVRCDEVDLFDPDLWRAVQLTTRSKFVGAPYNGVVRGSVEALSTMHIPGGLMWNLVADAHHLNKPVFRWGIVDVLAQCPPRYTCDSCPLWDECGGHAKTQDSTRRPDTLSTSQHKSESATIQTRRVPGFVSVEDALTLKARVDRATWESEMLCLRPSVPDAVYPDFDPAVHVFSLPFEHFLKPFSGLWLAGMDFGIRGQGALLLAHLDSQDVLRILDEHVRSDQTLEDQIRVIQAWNEKLSRVGACIEWIGIDPAGHQRSMQTGVSSANILKRAGLCVRSGRGKIFDGIKDVRARLGNARSQDGVNRVRLYIDGRCEQLVSSMTNYRFDPKARGRNEGLVPMKDGHDHAADALRYLIVNIDQTEIPTKLMQY